jgi:hypothetical protein
MKPLKLTFFAFFLVFASCNGNKQHTEAQKTIVEWIGRQIKFPNDFQRNILKKNAADTLYTYSLNSEYKILLYVDSAGCTSCKLQLVKWQNLINETDSFPQGKISFLFFFHPKGKKELQVLSRRDDFHYPIFIDRNNEVDKLNHFSKKPEYQCFLLDANNKVVMIGNPLQNPKIWDLYKQMIYNDTIVSSPKQSITSVEISEKEITLQGLERGKKSIATFKIKNTGAKPLVISRVNTSCGCTVPSWEKQAIKSGQTTEIEVEITPEESGFFHKTIQVYGNLKNGEILLAVKGEVN